jgi:hypothetical protein
VEFVGEFVAAVCLHPELIDQRGEFSMRRVFIPVAALCATFLMSAAAQAGITLSTLNQIQFENRENEVNVAGGTAGNLDVGDGLEGILRVNQLDPSGDVFGAAAANEPAGVFDVTVAKIIISSVSGTITQAVGTEVASASAITGQAGSSASVHVLFRPTNTTGAEGLLAGQPAGSVLALWEGGANLRASLNAVNSTATDIAAATDGTFLGAFGFGANAYAANSDWGAAGNGYWYATLDVFIVGDPDGSGGPLLGTGMADTSTNFFYGLEVLAGTLGGGEGPVGLFNKQLLGPSTIPSTTAIQNNRGISEFIAHPLAATPTKFDLVGRGNTSLNTAGPGGASGDANTRWVIFSNDPAQLFPTPEPTSFALLAMGAACGLPWIRRRIRGGNAA